MLKEQHVSKLFYEGKYEEAYLELKELSVYWHALRDKFFYL